MLNLLRLVDLLNMSSTGGLKPDQEILDLIGEIINDNTYTNIKDLIPKYFSALRF